MYYLLRAIRVLREKAVRSPRRSDFSGATFSLPHGSEIYTRRMKISMDLDRDKDSSDDNFIMINIIYKYNYNYNNRNHAGFRPRFILCGDFGSRAGTV